MKQFKDLSIDEQLDLVKHVLQGGKLEVFCAGDWLFDNEQEDSFTFHMLDTYRKMSDTLQILYKEQQDIQSKIEAELKRLGEPVTIDNTPPVQSPSKQEKTSKVLTLERITSVNWWSLGIKVGDKINVVNSRTYKSGIYPITDVEVYSYERVRFISADYTWWWYEEQDEVYLIRTKEGVWD